MRKLRNLKGQNISISPQQPLEQTDAVWVMHMKCNVNPSQNISNALFSSISMSGFLRITGFKCCSTATQNYKASYNCNSRGCMGPAFGDYDTWTWIVPNICLVTACMKGVHKSSKIKQRKTLLPNSKFNARYGSGITEEITQLFILHV